MGLTSFPGVSEGVLPIVIVNAALYVAVIRRAVMSLLKKLGFTAKYSEPEVAEFRPWSHEAEAQTQVQVPALGAGLARLAMTAVDIRDRLCVAKFEPASCLREKVSETEKCIFCFSKLKEGEEIRVLQCQHLFHKTCLDEWLEEHFICPLCKLCVVPEDEMRMREELLSNDLETWFSTFIPGTGF